MRRPSDILDIVSRRAAQGQLEHDMTELAGAAGVELPQLHQLIRSLTESRTLRLERIREKSGRGRAVCRIHLNGG